MKYRDSRNPARSAAAVIYADSLSNRGGTGVYLKRLLEGLCKFDASVFAIIGRNLMTPAEALSHTNFAGSIRKVINENTIRRSLTASISTSIYHLPAFSGRTPQNTPYAVTLHDLAFCRNPSWFPFLKSIYYRLHFRHVAGKADVIMVDSESTGIDAGKFLGIEENRIRKVYLSTDSFKADPALFRNYLSVRGKYIVYAGTIEPRKNISALLDSWEIVNRTHTDYSLVIAGRWGWGPDSLKNRLVDTDGVILTGALSEDMLKSCISGAELLVYPSLYEGFGLPPLEAASAGIPSVVTPASALTEIYSEISTVSKGFDPCSISESILHALETEHDSGALTDFAAAFSNERMARQVVKVYREFGK
ncbi:MAG: glycosyltransferase family 1 protein [Candidatus Fermentibacteria bacterium]